MAILTPIEGTPGEGSTNWGPTTKKYFNKFTTSTSMSFVHLSVIDALINNAIEKPIENSAITSPCIILVDSYGKATRAVAGTDYMSPSSTTTLSENQAINLGTYGYIGSNGNGQFVTLSATTVDTTTLNALGENGLVNATEVKASTFNGGDGTFAIVNATTHMSTSLVSTTTVNAQTINGVTGDNGDLNINTAWSSESAAWLGTVTVNGALNVTGNIAAPCIDVGNLTLNGRSFAVANAIATVCISTSAPGTEGTYTLWVNTSNNAPVLNYLSPADSSADPPVTASWVPLGAVFK